MSNWKNGKCVVYEDRHGNTRCGACSAPLFCDENGDMPNECPCCGAPLDYSIYDAEEPDLYVVTCECTDDGPEFMLYCDGKKHREYEDIVASFKTRSEAVACMRGLACY